MPSSAALRLGVRAKGEGLGALRKLLATCDQLLLLGQGDSGTGLLEVQVQLHGSLVWALKREFRV